MYSKLETYEHLVPFFLKAEEIGVHNLFGNDETSAKFWTLSCTLNDDSQWCRVPNNVLEPLDWIGFFHVYPLSTWSFFYYGQIFLE